MEKVLFSMWPCFPPFLYIFFIFTFALSVKGITGGVQTGEGRLAKFSTN